MTTITADLETAEEEKLLAYQPGQRIAIEFVVGASDGTKLTGEVTKCEPVEDEGEAYEEPEAAAPAGVPSALIVAVGKKK